MREVQIKSGFKARRQAILRRRTHTPGRTRPEQRVVRRRRGPRVVRVRLDLRLGAPQTDAEPCGLRLPGLLELRHLAAQVVALPRVHDDDGLDAFQLGARDGRRRLS